MAGDRLLPTCEGHLQQRRREPPVADVVPRADAALRDEPLRHLPHGLERGGCHVGAGVAQLVEGLRGGRGEDG